MYDPYARALSGAWTMADIWGIMQLQKAPSCQVALQGSPQSSSRPSRTGTNMYPEKDQVANQKGYIV